jgi:hypothetical protein
MIRNDDNKAQPAATIISSPVERASADAAEPAQQGDDQNDEYDCANAHLSLQLMMPEQG